MINVRERKFHDNFDLENESSEGRNFRSRERKFSGTKVPVIATLRHDEALASLLSDGLQNCITKQEY